MNKDESGIEVTEADLRVSRAMRELAALISVALNELSGEEYGFALVTFPFDRIGAGQFVSNSSDKEFTIDQLRTVANELANQQSSPLHEAPSTHTSH